MNKYTMNLTHWKLAMETLKWCSGINYIFYDNVTVIIISWCNWYMKKYKKSYNNSHNVLSKYDEFHKANSSSELLF